MQHVTVIIARKRWDCITMGWSRLLLVKKKNNKNNKNNNKGFRSWLEATHADDVVHMDDIFRIIDKRCEDVSPVSCTCIMELFGVYVIPWCFAYDRLNYARYLPCCNAQMYQLHTTHPDVHAEFMQGGFKSSLAPTTPSEESLSIKRSNKRWTRTERRQGDQVVQFETRGCEQILLDRRV